MPDPTNAARQRAWYARQKAGTPWQPLTCQACGANCKGKVCSRCWERLTVEGRAAKAERVRLSRARRRSDGQT